MRIGLSSRGWIKALTNFFVIVGFATVIYAQQEAAQVVKENKEVEIMPAGFAGGDGSTMQKAVVIKYIGDYGKSIGQEYEYLATKFGIKGRDWQLKLQELVAEGDQSYDRMTVELLPSKKIRVLYFNITEPFSILKKQFGEK